MENFEIHLLSYIVNSAGLFLLLLVFIGLNIKAAQILIAIFAYPVYLALLALESTIKPPKIRRFLLLNIPESNPKRFWMNSSAFMVALCLMPNIFKIYMAIGMPEETQAKVIMSLIFGNGDFQFWCNWLAVVFVLVIYLISYTTELDERDSWEKIEQLSVPALWKGVFKKIQ